MDPVGVATITPSAEKVVTYSSSTWTASRTRRWRVHFSTMISFIAHWAGNEVPSAGLRHHREPFLHTCSTFQRRPHEFQRIRTGLDLRQESEPAHLDAEHRAVRLGRHTRGPKERAVPADRDDQVGRSSRTASGPRAIPVVTPRPSRSCRSSLGRLDRARPAFVHDECHAAHEVASLPAASIAPSMSGVLLVPGPARACRRNSTLPAGPLTGETISPAARGSRRQGRLSDPGDAPSPSRPDLGPRHPAPPDPDPPRTAA